MNLIWTDTSWKQYADWYTIDKNIIKKIHLLIRDIRRDPFSGNGLGKPELLHGNLSGFASRHITGEHRLVYRVTESGIEILSCRGHYT